MSHFYHKVRVPGRGDMEGLGEESGLLRVWRLLLLTLAGEENGMVGVLEFKCSELQ